MAKIEVIEPHQLPQDEAKKRVDDLINVSVTADGVRVRVDFPSIPDALGSMVGSAISKALKSKLGVK